MRHELAAQATSDGLRKECERPRQELAEACTARDAERERAHRAEQQAHDERAALQDARRQVEEERRAREHLDESVVRSLRLALERAETLRDEAERTLASEQETMRAKHRELERALAEARAGRDRAARELDAKRHLLPAPPAERVRATDEATGREAIHGDGEGEYARRQQQQKGEDRRRRSAPANQWEHRLEEALERASELQATVDHQFSVIAKLDGDRSAMKEYLARYEAEMKRQERTTERLVARFHRARADSNGTPAEPLRDDVHNDDSGHIGSADELIAQLRAELTQARQRATTLELERRHEERHGVIGEDDARATPGGDMLRAQHARIAELQTTVRTLRRASADADADLEQARGRLRDLRDENERLRLRLLDGDGRDRVSVHHYRGGGGGGGDNAGDEEQGAETTEHEASLAARWPSSTRRAADRALAAMATPPRRWSATAHAVSMPSPNHDAATYRALYASPRDTDAPE